MSLLDVYNLCEGLGLLWLSCPGSSASLPEGAAPAAQSRLSFWAAVVTQSEGPGLVILIGTAFMSSLLKDSRNNNPKGFSSARGYGQRGCLFHNPAAEGEGMLSM